MSKLLTLKDRKTFKNFSFNPVFIGCMSERHDVEGYITVFLLADNTEEPFSIHYDYDDALKKWQEAVNT